MADTAKEPEDDDPRSLKGDEVAEPWDTDDDDQGDELVDEGGDDQ